MIQGQKMKFNKDTESIKKILELKITITEEFNRELQQQIRSSRRKDQ